MGGNFSRLVSRPTGNTVDGPADDSEWDNIIANMTPAGLDDFSANNTEMRSSADPYPGSSESLATSLEGELERLRYVLKQQYVTSQWYIYPDLVSKTAAYTATQDDKVILCDASGGAFTVILPAASGLTDKIFTIKKTDSSALAVTIDGNASETIDGLTTVTLDSQYSFAIIVCDGSNWTIIGGNATTQKWKKGADVASATALPVIGDGNYFDVTGTTAVTSINSLGIGTVIKLHFDGILTLTHHATDLVLPGAANITTAAGDEAELVQYADGDWRCTNYTKADGKAVVVDSPGLVVQTSTTMDGVSNTGTTVLPVDDVDPPQNTEGDEYITKSITPTSATNRLIIEFIGFAAHSVSGGNLTAALFQDSTANALAVGYIEPASANDMMPLHVKYEMAAGTTSSTTFKVRIGGSTAGTLTFNGSGGSGLFAGTIASSLSVTEIAV